MNYDKAIKAALRDARKYIPVDTGRLRRSIKVNRNGLTYTIVGFDYPAYINGNFFKISQPERCLLRTTYNWENEFSRVFFESFSRNIGGDAR
nr:MAG TPA: putative tail component [Caudoviricetes sp.]